MIRTVTAIRRNPITESTAKASPTPMTHTAGTGSTIWMHQTTDCWMILISFRVRVIMEPVPNCSKSWSEKVRDFS